jgi:hypothetical protein
MLKRGNTVELLNEREFSTCKICGKTKYQTIYKFQYAQYIPDYIPEILIPVCRKCVYKEVYGNKGYIKKMKERTLDGKQ